MPEGKIDKLYNSLKGEGYDLPDLATFTSDMTDETKRTKLYTSLKGEGYDLPDFATFTSDIVPEKKNSVPNSGTPSSTGTPPTSPSKSPSLVSAPSPDYGQMSQQGQQKIQQNKSAYDSFAQYEQTQKALSEADKNINAFNMLGDVSKIPDPNVRNQAIAELNNLKSIRQSNKQAADNIYAQVEQRVNKFGDEAIKEKSLDYFLKTNESGIKVADPNKIDEYVKNISIQAGLPDTGYFKDLFYNNLKSKVEYEKVKPQIETDFNKLYQQKFGTIPKQDIEKEFKTKFIAQKQIEAQLNLQAKGIAENIQAEREKEIGAVSQNYEPQLKGLNSDYEQQASALSEQAKQLNALAQSGQLDEQTYNQQFAQLKAQGEQLTQQYQQTFNQTAGDFLAAQKEINGKYAKRYERQISEIKAMADARLKSESEKFSKEYKVSPELQKKYADTWKEATQKFYQGQDAALTGLDMIKPASYLFAQSFVSGLGTAVRGLSTSLDFDAGRIFGDVLSSTYSLSNPEIKTASELLDMTKLIRSSGEMIGGMAPLLAAQTIAAVSTSGASIPVQLAVQGGLGFTMETMQMGGNMYDEVFAKTGNVSEAEKAAAKLIEGNSYLLPLYAIDGLPFVEAAGLGIKSTLLRGLAKGGIETATEIPQEYFQGAFEDIARNNKELSDIGEMMTSDRLKNTVLNVLPSTFAMGTIPTYAGGIKKAWTQIEAKSLAAKHDLSRLSDTAMQQYMYDMYLRYGETFSKAYLSGLEQANKFDEATIEKLNNTLNSAKIVLENSDKIGLKKGQTKVYAALMFEYESAAAQTENEPDEILKIVADKKANEAKKLLTDFLSGEQVPIGVMILPNNEQYVYSESKLSTMLEDPAIVAKLQKGELDIVMMGKGGLAAKIKQIKDNELTNIASEKPVEPTTTGINKSSEGETGNAAEGKPQENVPAGEENLAEKLKSIGASQKMIDTVSKNATISRLSLKEGGLASGYHEPYENKIYISTLAKILGHEKSTIIHETAHLLTSDLFKQVENLDTFNKEDVDVLKKEWGITDEDIKNVEFIKDTFEKAKKANIAKNIIYGYKNIDEFVAEFVSNNKFRKTVSRNLDMGEGLVNKFIHGFMNILSTVTGINISKVNEEKLNEINTAIESIYKNNEQEKNAPEAETGISDGQGTSEINLNKEVKNAVQERPTTEEISRTGETGENQPQDSGGVRQGEQGKELAPQSEEIKVENGKIEAERREKGRQNVLTTPQEDTGGEQPPVVELSEPEKTNLQSIEKETGDNFRLIQNTYNKYGEGKPLSEITAEDYQKAKDKREKSKGPPPEPKKEYTPEDEQKAKSFLDALVNRSEGTSEETKKQMADDLGLYYTVQSENELKSLSKAVIEQLGGIDKAVNQAKSKTSGMPAPIKIMVLGQALIEARDNESAATTPQQKAKYANEQIDYANELDLLGRSYGRAINAIKMLYYQSSLAVAMKIKKEAEERNEKRAPQAKKEASKVKEILTDETTVTESIDAAANDVIGEMQGRISDLEKEIEKLKKGSTPKKKRLNIVSESEFKSAKKKIFSAAYSNPFANPEFWKDATTIALYGIQEGINSAADMYVYLKKNLRGKYSEAYGEIYKRARNKAVELGEDVNQFDTDEVADDKINHLREVTKAEEIAKATAKKAKLQAKKEANASKIIAERILSDAKKTLNLEETKPESDALQKIINGIVKKAQDKYTKELPKSKAIQQVLSFAFETQARAKELYNAAQKEVEESIKNSDLTDEEKSDVNKFLETYKNSIFDIILNNGQQEKIVREALIEAGYGVEVNGKPAVDWKKLIYGSKTPAQAAGKMRSVIIDKLGVPESEAKSIIDAIENRLYEIVKEKKLAAVNTYLKAINRYNAKTIIKKSRRTRIEKLIDLWNAGALKNDDVMNNLAREFGVQPFTTENQKTIEDYVNKIDEAPLGAEREKLEEELQAYVESLDSGFLNKAMQERMTLRFLQGPVTFIKNMGGFIDTVQQVLSKFIQSNTNWGLFKGNVDTNVMVVAKNAMRMAKATAMDVLINGGVDYGSAFSEITGTKEGTPRVRYVEYQKTTVPKLQDQFSSNWAKMFGKAFDTVNPYKVYAWLRNTEKYGGRALSSPDSYNQIMLGEMKSYTFLKRKIMMDNPTLSAKEASKMAYEQLYPVDKINAEAQATKEFNDRGINLDFSKSAIVEIKGKKIPIYPDKIRFQRRVYEIMQQGHTEETIKAASEYANRYTYKTVDAGIMTPVYMGIQALKKTGSLIAAGVRRSTDNPTFTPAAEKAADAIEMANFIVWNNVMPFMKGVSAVIEKQLEFDPTYGSVKTAFNIGRAGYAKFKGDKEKTEEYFSRAGEGINRVIVGMLVLALIRSWVDDDDEDNMKKVYGSGAADEFKKKGLQKLRPENTIIIKGRAVPMDLFGPFSMSLRLEGAFLDLMRYEKENLEKFSARDRIALQTMYYSSAVISNQFTAGIADFVRKISDPASASSRSYWERRAAETVTRTALPWVGFGRQLSQFIDPKAKKPLGFPELVAKYSGIYFDRAVDRPAIDYRGREYNTYELYPNSAAGWANLYKKMKIDDVDLFVGGSESSITDPRVTDERYFVPDTDGLRPMEPVEYYEFLKQKSKYLDEYLRLWVDRNPGFKPNTAAKKKVAQAEINDMNTKSLKDAYRKVFGDEAYALTFQTDDPNKQTISDIVEEEGITRFKWMEESVEQSEEE